MEVLLSGSMISARRASRLGPLVLSVLAALLLVGCGPNQVIVEGNFPTPLMDPVPVVLGVYYPEAFQTHEFFDEAKTRTESDWIVKTGEAQVQMWDNLLQGMFTEMVSQSDSIWGMKTNLV